MESWRQELYSSMGSRKVLKHTAEGSSWKNHKYIAIENGRYIYPEDLPNKKKTSSSAATEESSGSSSGGSSSGSSKKPSESKVEKNPDGSIKVKDKGSVKNYEYLPDDPEIGDMYLLEDTKVKVYWDGEIWTPYKEPAAQTGGGYYGGGEKDSGKVGNYTLSQETIDRIRNALSNNTGSSVRSNVRNFGGGR